MTRRDRGLLREPLAPRPAGRDDPGSERRVHTRARAGTRLLPGRRRPDPRGRAALGCAARLGARMSSASTPRARPTTAGARGCRSSCGPTEIAGVDARSRQSCRRRTEAGRCASAGTTCLSGKHVDGRRARTVARGAARLRSSSVPDLPRLARRTAAAPARAHRGSRFPRRRCRAPCAAREACTGTRTTSGCGCWPASGGGSTRRSRSSAGPPRSVTSSAPT